MNKNKIKILTLGFVGAVIGMLGFYQSALAASASVYVEPATLTKNAGEMFDISVGVNPGGDKVCAVEGKLNLDQLSCESVQVKDEVVPQTSPSCGNLYFLLGIPGCTTNDKKLFTVTVKAENTGTATANFTGVDIIGESISISSASLGGNYTLTTPTTKEEITPPVEEEKITPPAEEEISSPTEEEISSPTEEVATSEKELVAVPTEEKPAAGGLASMLAALGMVGSEISQSAWRIIIIILCLIGLILVGIKEWLKIRKKKKMQ